MTVIFFLLLGFGLMGLNLFFSPSKYAQQSIFVFVFAVCFFVAGIWIVQSSSYGLIELSDSELYTDIVRAIVAHWSGHDVWIPNLAKSHLWEILPLGTDTTQFMKDAHTGEHNWLWTPQQSLHYPTAFNGPVIYPLIVASFVYLTNADITTAIYLNALFLAAVAQLIFLIGCVTLGNQKWGLTSGILFLLDTGFLAIGAYILRDAIIVWCIYGLALCLYAVLQSNGGKLALQVIIATFLLALVALLRIPLYYATIFAIIFLITAGWGVPSGKRRIIVTILVLGIGCSLYAMGGQKVFHSDKRLLAHISYPVHFMRTAFYRQQIIQLNKVNKVKEVSPASNAIEGEGSKTVESQASSPVTSERITPGAIASESYEIKAVFNTEGLLLTGIKAVARSLFAPYPWSLITQGRIGTWPELFFPGMFIWILGLPFALIYLPAVLRDKQPAMIYPLLITLFCAFVYIVWDGEYSTRARLMSMPLAWLMVAGGVQKVLVRWKKKS
jgi:hypothetical protein